MASRGRVWLVGAGPGDPGLITVRGLEVLRAAEVVLYDALSHPALLELCAADADVRNVGKRGGQYSPDQEWITSQLIEFARLGKKVVRLKGGDSFLFARGAEEALALARAGIDFEIVPGLSSPVGTAAYAGIPLTHRELSSSVTFITGSDRDGEEWSDAAWHKLATATDTLCILMGMRKLAQIAAALVAGGRPATTPVAVVQWGARPEQRVAQGTLSDIAEKVQALGLSNPAVIIVGEVVSLRDELRWYDRRPLFGKRILIPRPQRQAANTARLIRERAAEPLVFPAIEIAEPPDLQPLRSAITELERYDTVVFTSANGVERFFHELKAAGRDARALGRAKVAVIGPKTAQALTAFGITADLVAKEFVGEALASEILALSPQRVLIARALVARDQVPDTLRAGGIEVTVVPVYETRAASAAEGERLAALIRSGAVDVVLFTSSSTVNSIVAVLGSDAQRLLGELTVASIGPITSATLAEHGLLPTVVATTYTVEGLLDAVEAHFTTLTDCALPDNSLPLRGLPA